MPAEPSTGEEPENPEATIDNIEPDAKPTGDPTESEPQTAEEPSESQAPGEEPKAESEQTEPAGEPGAPEEKPSKKKGGKGGKKGKKKQQQQQDEVKESASETNEATTTVTESEAEGAGIIKKEKTKKGKKKKAKEQKTTDGDGETEDEQPPTESKGEGEPVAGDGETQKDQKKKKKGKKDKSESTEGEGTDGGDTTAKKKGKKKKGKSKEQPEAGDVETGGEKKKKGGKKGAKGGDKKKKKKKDKSETATDTATASEDAGEEKPSKKKKKGGKGAKKKKGSARTESVTGEGDAGHELGKQKSKSKKLDRESSMNKPKGEPSSILTSMIESKTQSSTTPNDLLAEFFSSSSSSSGDEDKDERIIATTILEVEPVERQKKGKKGKKGGKKGGDKGKKGEKRKEPPTESATETDEEPSTKEKKKKKDKKGKKTKKGAKTEEEDKEPAEIEQDDVMAEIMRMKAMAAAQALGPEAVEEPTDLGDKVSKKKSKKKKKGPKKKMSKKEKVKMTAEMAEKARLEAEQMALRAAEEERIRLEQERRAAIEKEKRETMEQEIRKEQLALVREIFKETEAYNRSLSMKARELAEWNFYVSCDRLPDASKCDQMTTYLHLWQKVIDETTIEDASQRTTDVLQLLDTLDSLIDAGSSDDNFENWKWVRQLLRDHQAKSLDVATYRLLRNIDKNLNRIDIPTADFKYHDANLALCLWLRIQLPTPMPNPRRPPKPRIHIDFKEMNMNVLFPESINCEKMAIRAMYLKYDHLSDLSATYERPEIPEEYQLDLYDATRIEWREKMKYKYDNRVIPQSATAKPSEDGKEETDETKDTTSEKSARVFGLDEEIPAVPYQKLSPTASEYVIANEETTFVNIRRRLQQKVDDDEINLRKFSIIGGVYLLNLVYQPPQPQDFVTIDLDLTPLYVPKELEFVDFHVEYTPPPPPEPGVRRLPEEIEEELKKQEQELDKLMLVTLTWPEHVIFLELPLVGFWDTQRRTWTKQEVHDLKHNEEKGQLTFRTGKLGIFALATYSYANLPYQAWEMRPEAKWNLTAGRRNVVMQMREYQVDKPKQKNHSMLLVTPLKALFVDCTEVSQTFSEEGIEGMKFYSDLYHLMKGTSPMFIRNKLNGIEKELVFGLYELLVATRVVSFS